MSRAASKVLTDSDKVLRDAELRAEVEVDNEAISLAEHVRQPHVVDVEEQKRQHHDSDKTKESAAAVDDKPMEKNDKDQEQQQQKPAQTQAELKDITVLKDYEQNQEQNRDFEARKAKAKRAVSKVAELDYLLKEIKQAADIRLDMTTMNKFNPGPCGLSAFVLEKYADKLRGRDAANFDRLMGKLQA